MRAAAPDGIMAMDPRRRTVKSDINVTPLVDVVLVLLIVFMVVTPLLQRGRPVQLPRARAVAPLEQGGDTILISVTADGRAFLGQKEIARGELSRAIAAERTARPGSPIVLKGDRSLEYGVVRKIVLELSKANVVGISLAAAPVDARGGE